MTWDDMEWDDTSESPAMVAHLVPPSRQLEEEHGWYPQAVDEDVQPRVRQQKNVLVGLAVNREVGLGKG